MTTEWHASTALVRRYVAGDTGIAAEVEWAVEVHLESCAECRAKVVEHASVAPLLDQVWAAVEPATSAVPAGRRRRWLATWASPAMVPWLAMTVLVTLMALVADLTINNSYPSLVLLIAPIAPVAGVAAAWGRGMDPAYELVAATPRAGLYLLLRRTVAVLVVVIPLLAVTTWLSPVRWLLPCLAFTVATLALGGFVGMRRAAIGLVAGWSAIVVGPSLVAARPPAVLEPAGLGVWAAVLVLGACVVWLRGGAFNRLDLR